MVSEKTHQRVQDTKSRPDTGNQSAACVIRTMWDNNNKTQ